MSVLDKPNVPEITPAIRISSQIKQTARGTYQQLLTTFENSVRLFWRNPQATPAEIASALGTDAREVFQLHAKLGALLNEIKPGCIANAVNVIGDVTYNDDGTITVKPKTTPFPAPAPTPTPASTT